LAVVRVQRLEPSPAEQLRLRKTGVFRPLRAKVIAGAIRRRRPNELWQRLGEDPPTLFAFAQCLFGLLLAGHVQVQALDEAEGAVRGELPVAARPNPPDRAVLVPNAVLCLVHPPLPQGG